MRAPRRRREMRRVPRVPDDVDLVGLAASVSYTGSPEHKDMPSFAGHPRPRADASICPRELTRDPARIGAWLGEAMRKGAVGGIWEGDFPRYAWYKEGEQVYEARLVNRGKGEYKGYPLGPDEWPDGIEELYG